MIEKIYLNDNWTFTPEGGNSEVVRIPHTVKEVPFHYFSEELYQMVSTYEKDIEIKKEWLDKAIILEVGAAAHDATLFVNDKEVMQHHTGYTAFSLDIQEFVHEGLNHIKIVVDSRESLNIPPFGLVIDYLTYGGIYRDVTLTIKDKAHFADSFVYTVKLPDGKYQVAIEDTLSKEGIGGTVTHVLKDPEGKEIPLLADRVEIREKNFVLYKPILPVEWSIETPVLYTITSVLKIDGVLRDENTVRFGFREAIFKNDGFYLNGKKVKIRGLNRHQSYPYVGYAMPDSMQVEDARILKEELHVNSVRTSHYPQSHAFLDACDEMGLLVFTELPGWQHIGDDAWKDQALLNVKEMVEQYRNHPSIILWGVRINESMDDDAFYEKTNLLAHKLDPSRQTGGVRYIKKSNLLEDVYTYNDFVHDGIAPGCDPKKKVTSDMSKPYLITENNGHMYPTKSYDTVDKRTEHAIRHARVLDAVASHEDITGSFSWCMFDYNTHKDFGSGDHICHHGVMDMFRNPKLAASIYAACQDEDPVLTISSNMDIGESPESTRGVVYAFTNADSVKMYKNDEFIWEFYATDTEFPNMPHGPIEINDFIGNRMKKEGFSESQEKDIKEILNAAAKYGMGKMPKKYWRKAAKLMIFKGMKMQQAVDLYTEYVGNWGARVVTYKFEAIKDGKVVATVIKKPVLKPYIKAKANTTTLHEEHTYDVAAIRITFEDDCGNVLPFMNDPVSLKVSGPVELIGPSIVTLNGGMGGTYIKTTGEKGTATLTIESEACETVKLTFEVK